MADVQQRTRFLRRSRALSAAAAVLELADFGRHLAAGSLAAAFVLGFAGVMFAVLVVAQTVTIRRMRAEVQRVVPVPRAGGFLFDGPAELVPQQGRDDLDGRLPAAAALRSAWDVSMTLDPSVPWNDVCHYDDATRKLDGIAAGVIRVIPRTAERPFWQVAGTPVITSWTIVTRAPSHGEGIDLLKAAEPLLRERLAGLADGRARYFQLLNGALAEAPAAVAPFQASLGATLLPPVTDLARAFARLGATLCAHESAEPVDLLVTGERVAWLCPECGAELPADWR